MSHIVLAVGATALCLSGSVWYLPAVADLRAGDDRPRSRRLGASACVTTWAAAAVAGLLLFGDLLLRLGNDDVGDGHGDAGTGRPVEAGRLQVVERRRHDDLGV
ncbi:hypothetical protein, partial [Streptosporangium nondiastaticum]|uniref:hypothetical protein n=1 Tax=Streptosporangium nondiastaticum TaxID=35764 RepID=UPI0011B1D3AC